MYMDLYEHVLVKLTNQFLQCINKYIQQDYICKPPRNTIYSSHFYKLAKLYEIISAVINSFVTKVQTINQAMKLVIFNCCI